MDDEKDSTQTYLDDQRSLLNQEFKRNFMVLRVVIVTNSYDAELSWAAATFKLAASCETMRPAVLHIICTHIPPPPPTHTHMHPNPPTHAPHHPHICTHTPPHTHTTHTRTHTHTHTHTHHLGFFLSSILLPSICSRIFTRSVGLARYWPIAPAIIPPGIAFLAGSRQCG